MSDAQQGGGCACCGTADSTNTGPVVGSPARTRFVTGAVQIGQGGDRPGMPAEVVDLHEDIVTGLAAVARLQAALTLVDGMPGSEVVCTLDGGLDAMRGRIGEWNAVIGQATGREPAEGGVTLVYDHDPALTVELARLAAAEFACCSFFTFALSVVPEGVRFTVTAPDEARTVLTALFGTATPPR